MASHTNGWQGGLIDCNGGETFWALGDTMHIKLGSAQSNDAFMFGIVITEPRSGPPPHVHTREDEAFYVLEGDVEFLLGDKIHPAPVGSFVFAPRNVVHQFRNIGAGPAKMLFWSTDCNFERFYREMAVPAGAPDFVPPAIDGSTIEKVVAIATRYGLRLEPTADADMRVSLPADKMLWVLGEKVKILTHGDANEGQLCVTEITGVPGGGPPVHRHRDQHEVFYVLDGEFDLQLGDQTVRATAGDTVHVPPMTFHRYSNAGRSPARIMSFHTPSGMEHFFEECGSPCTDEAVAPAPHLSLEQIIQLLARHKMELPAR